MENKYTTNIFPSDIIKLAIHPSDRKLVSLLRHKADETCRFKISSSYIYNAFNKFKKGYYYTNDSNNIIGFSLWKDYKNIQKDGTILKKIHVILICADYNDYRLGRKILYDIESYSIDTNIPIISLEAANDELVKYYQDGGFSLINKRNNEMEKEVTLFTAYRKIKKKIEG